jgi:hypothetical protein
MGRIMVTENCYLQYLCHAYLIHFPAIDIGCATNLFNAWGLAIFNVISSRLVVTCCECFIRGISNRGGYDLETHQVASGQSMQYTDRLGRKFVPHIIEPAVGLDRLFLAFLTDAIRSGPNCLKLDPRSVKNIVVNL